MDSKIKAQALNAAFPGNTLGLFDEPDAVIPDAFVPGPGPARAWVQAALTQHEANLPRPPVPASAAPQLLEFAHYANLGAAVEREALDAIELTVDNVLGHVSETLRFDPRSLRRTEMARRIGTFVAGHAAACLAQARRAPGSQASELQHAACQARLTPGSQVPELQHAACQARLAPGSQVPELQFVREALTAALLAATHRGDFSAADDVDNAAALAEFLVPHLTLEQRQELAPWLLRAGGAASEAVRRDVRDSFAQLQASSPAYLDASTHSQLDASSLAQLQSTFGARPPLLAAAARKVQTWYFRAAAKAWAPGLPSSERLRLQAETAPLEGAAAAGAWPQPLKSVVAAAPAALHTDASANVQFHEACMAAVRAAKAAGTGLDAATAQRLESAFMALDSLERRIALRVGSAWWLAPLCLARPGCLARLIQGQSPEVRAGTLGQAAAYGPELIAEWAPLMLADKVQPLEDYTPWRSSTPPKSAAERRDNLKRLNIGLDALKALAVHFPHDPLTIEPLSIALYAGLEGLRAAAPVFGFDVRQLVQNNYVIQALFMAAAPEACANLLAFVRPQPKVEALAWAPMDDLMEHVGSEQLLALMQAQPPTTETEAGLYLEAALAGRVDLLELIRGHSEQPHALMTAPILPSAREPAQSLLDCFASPTQQSAVFFDSPSSSWSPEVVAHLTRAALALPPQFRVPAEAAACAIDGDDPGLLRALNARAPLTPDDWWQALYASKQAKPSMLQAISEHLASAGQARAGSKSEASADLLSLFQARLLQVDQLLEAAAPGEINAAADVMPGAITGSYDIDEARENRDLVRFTALRELTVKAYLPMDLRISVAKLPALERLVVDNSCAKVKGWGALAALPQLTTLQIVGSLSDEALEELLTAGLAPKLDLHRSTLTAHGRARALAAMRDCVPQARWPEPAP